MLKAFEATDDGIVVELPFSLRAGCLNHAEDGAQLVHQRQNAAYQFRCRRQGAFAQQNEKVLACVR